MKQTLIQTKLQIIFSAILLIICINGCLNPFAPKIEQSSDLEFLITEQTTPDEVLTNFKLAYLFRDSILYSDIIDSSFTFYYFDTDIDAAGIPLHWDRDTDLRTTGRIFRTFDIINLIWESTIFTDTLDWDENQEANKIDLIKRFSLNLMQTTESLSFDLWGKASFTFERSPYDDRWRITRWTDESFN